MDWKAFVKHMAQHVSAACLPRLLCSLQQRSQVGKVTLWRLLGGCHVQGVRIRVDDSLWWDLEPFMGRTATSTTVRLAALAQALSESPRLSLRSHKDSCPWLLHTCLACSCGPCS